MSDPEIDLDHVRGKVVTNEEVTIPASQNSGERTDNDHRVSETCSCARGSIT